MGNIVKVKGLVKRFGSLLAVNDIDLIVSEGQLFAFLGPNGAGKSTTINIICTLMEMTSGEVQVDGLRVGRDDQEIRKRIGVVFQNNVLDELLTVRENLKIRGSLYGISPLQIKEKTEQVSVLLAMQDLLDRPFGILSGGQKRRAEIARALMNNAKLLVLDEPTTGLDPQTRLWVWQMIHQLRQEMNVTVFLTTHYLEEAASADWVSIIDRGKIVAEGTPVELREKYSRDTLRIIPSDSDSMKGILVEKGYSFTEKGEELSVLVQSSLDGFDLLRALEGSFRSFEMVKGNMDDVFVSITGRSIREEG